MNIIIFLFLLFNSVESFASASSDPLFSKQWALHNEGQVVLKNISDLERISIKGVPGIDVNWVETKDLSTSKSGLIVAVIDSGVDIEHPDLKDRIWYNDKLCFGATNAKILACNGFNTLDNNNILTDDVGHGTHVAGIIAANRNTIGVAGAADSRVKIMPLKVLNSEVKGFVYNGKLITDAIADAVNFAVKNGAEVINLSLGWPKLIDTPKVRKAFQDAEEKNVIIVAAAGNNNKDLPTFPCAYENVICVGAMDNRGVLTDFSNHGAKVDVVAPGESIISTYPRALESRVLRIKNYETKRGSSQAAPFVTAAIANLKLFNSELTNDQVRNFLFRSGKSLNSKVDRRFIKYGMLDMKALLEISAVKEEEAFINPELKGLTEVKYKTSDRKFSFNIKLKNLSSIDYQGLVCIKAFSRSIQLDQNCVSLNLISAHQSFSLPVSGMLLSLTGDSHIIFQVQIDQHVFQTSLVFSRDLNEDSAVLSFPLGHASFDDMGVIRGETRASRMTRVIDKFKLSKLPEYFYLEKLKQSETNTVISLIANENENFTIKSLNLPKVAKVLSIHRQDINFDGKIDYMIYTLSNKKDELQFYFFNEKLGPLFNSKSKWSFPLSTFEGLPIEGGVEKFEWIKIKNSSLGNVLVPSIYRSYEMPEADNSKTIADRVIGSGSHQFYLNPIVTGDDVKLELRVLDSVKVVKMLRTALGVLGAFDDKTVHLLKPFPQTLDDVIKGNIKSLLVLDEAGLAKFYQVTLNSDSGKASLNLIPLTTEKAVDQSLIYPVVHVESGDMTNEAVLTSLLNRSRAEFFVKKENEIGGHLKLDRPWEDPIIALSAIFEDHNGKSFFIESRGSMSILRDNGESAELPIYRDSSFPGQNFSETLVPILANGRPGMYINSTLIFGERLYSMIDSVSEGFIRPLALSVALPSGCVPLSPESLGKKNETHYAFLCTGTTKEVSLKFLPMSLF